MKSYILFSLVFISLAINTAFSQVAINMTGDDPDPSAMLDISATDKGLLIPRVSLNGLDNSINPIPAPATGLMIFNVEGNDYSSGLYIWTGFSWTPYATMEQVINTIPQFAESASFGEVYEYNPSGSYSSIVIPDAGTWVPWNTGIAGNITNMNTDSSSLVVTTSGSFSVSFNSAAQLNKAGYVVEAAVFVNGIRKDNLSSRNWFKEHSKPYTFSLSGILYLEENDVVNIRFSLDDDGIIKLETANLSLNKID